LANIYQFPGPQASSGIEFEEEQIMVSPQVEDGHIDIANEIGEALAKTHLSGYESRVLWVIWRKTYGWHKKSDAISITQFEKATGLKRRHISRTLQSLLERNIVTKNGNGFIDRWAFQKNYSKWNLVTKNGDKFKPSPKMVTPTVTKNGAYKSKVLMDIKKRTMMWSHIKNLLSQFPKKITDMVDEYIELARLENKTKRITLQKRRRLINELHLLWTSCNSSITQKDFEKALRITVNKEAPNVNYVKKVMKGIMNKRALRLKGGGNKHT